MLKGGFWSLSPLGWGLGDIPVASHSHTRFLAWSALRQGLPMLLALPKALTPLPFGAPCSCPCWAWPPLARASGPLGTSYGDGDVQLLWLSLACRSPLTGAYCPWAARRVSSDIPGR